MKFFQSYYNKFVVAFMFLLVSELAYSQSVVNLYKNISVKQFNDIIDTCSTNQVQVNIYFGNLIFKGDSAKPPTIGRTDKNLDITFCQHYHNLQFENLILLSNIGISEPDSLKIKYDNDDRLGGYYSIKNCIFKNSTSMSIFARDLFIEDSKFKSSFWQTIERSESMGINTTYKSYQLRILGGVANFENCTFSDIYTTSGTNSTEKTSNLRLKKCLLDSIEDPQVGYHKLFASLNSIKMDSCIIRAPIVFEGTCESMIITSSGRPQFDFSQFTFPNDAFRVQIPIDHLDYDPVITFYNTQKIEISKNMSQLEINFLVAAHKKLLNLYQENGDQASYNKLYRFSKRAKNIIIFQQKDKNIQVWFVFYFNRFLDWYCDYGTNPAKALIYSFYVILLFASVYILVPSEPDNLQRHYFIKKMGKYLSYFSSDAHLADLKRIEYEKELAELDHFRLNIEDMITKAPSIIPWISKPYYRISMMYFNIHLWFLDKADFAQLSWDNMSKKQRLKASSIMTIYMLGFVFGGVAVRIINGIALSLNAFITLGYGEISAKGIARYLAVVEGCIGWFLLSIFSVSLIAQMMQ